MQGYDSKKLRRILMHEKDAFGLYQAIFGLESQGVAKLSEGFLDLPNPFKL